MATGPASNIEIQFARLSPEAQLGLLERLLHRVRLSLAGSQELWEAELADMAADPEMQRQLREIDAEFGPTEADGLENR